jgi:tetratricopeptide (TPR) repeat protein
VPRAPLVLLIALLPLAAQAQTYGLPAPQPRSTDPAVLRRIARDREVHERFRRGLDAEAGGAWDAAAAEFRRAIALDPPEPKGSTARYDLALALAHTGRRSEAMDQLDDALRRDPGFAAAAANLTSLALEAGDIPRARSAADRFVRIAPDAARAHYARALAALRGGDLNVARSEFGALLGSDPAYAVAHYDLGLVELRAGNVEAATAEFRRAVALAPGYARARFALAEALIRGGQRDDAARELDRTVADASDPALRALASALRAELR